MTQCAICKSEMTFRRVAADGESELWTCPNHGKVQLYVSASGPVRQRRNGRAGGVNNKAKNVSIRPGAKFLARIKDAGYTVQEWWNYTESLDIPARG